ncbi:MAG: hypothetical protein CL912_33510 [Deltaproteobacteria bacterium]|nr:hypothetical protein [Deltaproteobacteria bacterium]|tara:strand:- start:1059 stop:1544 length:486 start_codon:yes stop_codon:yes gene_type:complete
MSKELTHTLHTTSIYHGLPVYPSTITPKVAIITGANGISGFHTLRVLASAPERWSKIYALSRRPPPPRLMNLVGDGKERVEHVACDFLLGPEEIAKALKGRVESVDAVFFYSYFQPRETSSSPPTNPDIANLASQHQPRVQQPGPTPRNWSRSTLPCFATS